MSSCSQKQISQVQRCRTAQKKKARGERKFETSRRGTGYCPWGKVERCRSSRTIQPAQWEKYLGLCEEAGVDRSARAVKHKRSPFIEAEVTEATFGLSLLNGR